MEVYTSIDDMSRALLESSGRGHFFWARRGSMQEGGREEEAARVGPGRQTPVNK